MRCMSKTVQLHFQPENSLEITHRRQTVRLRDMLVDVHAVGAFKIAQAHPHQRKTVHLSLLPKIVHQRQRIEVSNIIEYNIPNILARILFECQLQWPFKRMGRVGDIF